MRGFTFIEVLIAMLIFTLCVVAAVDIASGSVRATREAKQISQASWLLQGLMADFETRLETEGIEKACDKKKEGKFDAPNDKFTYQLQCYEIDFKISEGASALMGKKDDEDSNRSQEDIFLKMILDTASSYISKSLRELHAEIYWYDGKTKRKVSATTHFVRFDQPVQLPSFPTAPETGGGGGGGS